MRWGENYMEESNWRDMGNGIRTTTPKDIKMSSLDKRDPFAYFCRYNAGKGVNFITISVIKLVLVMIS